MIPPRNSYYRETAGVRRWQPVIAKALRNDPTSIFVPRPVGYDLTKLRKELQRAIAVYRRADDHQIACSFDPKALQALKWRLRIVEDYKAGGCWLISDQAAKWDHVKHNNRAPQPTTIHGVPALIAWLRRTGPGACLVQDVTEAALIDLIKGTDATYQIVRTNPVSYILRTTSSLDDESAYKPPESLDTRSSVQAGQPPPAEDATTQ